MKRILPRVFRSTTLSLLELLLSFTLVLMFFAVLVMVLGLFFPSGFRIQNLVQGETSAHEPIDPASADRVFQMNLNPGNMSPGIAVLTVTRNEVKSRSADAIVWTQAKEGMSLQDRDAVQTFKRADARINFDEDNYIDLAENTLLIVKRLEESLLRNHKRSYLLMMNGALKGRLTGSGGKRVHLELATPSGTAHIRSPATAGDQAEFGIKVNPDKSSTFTVERGTIEVWANGEKVQVGADEYTRVEPSQGPSTPRPLPLPPAPLLPRDGSTFLYRELAPRIGFRWSKMEEGDMYHFVLARDNEFKNVIYEEELSQPEFTYGNWKSGRYWWKIRCVRDGIEGRAGKARSVQLVEDVVAPKLEVEFPSGVVKGDEFMLRGQTDPGVQVFIGDEEIPTKTGTFKHVLTLQPGLNRVVVEAVDSAGNQTYRSQIVNSKP